VDSLVAAIDKARAELVQAEQEDKLVWDPAPEQFQHVVEPARQAVVAAEAQLRKLQTGGSRDQATLELNAATARAELDRLQAVLAGNSAGELAARLAGAEAALAEASFRVQQAASGQGGRDTRAEDIAIAQAEFTAAKEQVLALIQVQPEKIASARAGVEAAQAGVRIAEGKRDACGKIKTYGITEVNGQETDPMTVTDPNCPGDLDDANERAVEIAEKNVEIAQQGLNLLTNPGMPQALYLLGPFAKAAEAAGARLQKAASGGGTDQRTRDLDVALAQAEVDRWRAEPSLLRVEAEGARLTAAQSELDEAAARGAQAAAGQGGAEVRAEDIAAATAKLEGVEAGLALVLDPLQEVVRSAQLAIDVVDLAARQVRSLAPVCDDIRLVTTLEDNDNSGGDNDGSDNLDLEVETGLDCPGEIQDGLEDVAEGLEGFKLVPEAALSELTESNTNEELQVRIARIRAEVARADANVRGLKAGGPDDPITLASNLAQAQARLACRQAVLAEVSQGSPPTQTAPFVWADPDPCAPIQLPGRIPPFQQQDVRGTSPPLVRETEPDAGAST
jgi:hypothetical protein